VWIITAWQGTSPEVTVKGAKAVDGTDDGMLWNDSEGDEDVSS